jgi:hypothetical protein
VSLLQELVKSKVDYQDLGPVAKVVQVVFRHTDCISRIAVANSVALTAAKINACIFLTAAPISSRIFGYIGDRDQSTCVQAWVNTAL